MIVHLVDGRVKGFASRGCRGYAYGNVLRLPVAFHEGQWVLHWLLDGLEGAAVGAYAGRFIRHVSPRSVEAHLFRGLHGARRRRRPREISEERGRTPFPARPILCLRVDFRTGFCELRCLLFQSSALRLTLPGCAWANCRAWKRAVRCSMVKNGTINAGMSTKG